MSDYDPYDGKPSETLMAERHRRNADLDAKFHAKLHANITATNPERTAQLVAMFARLDDYGQRVTIAQMAAILRLQTGA